MPSLCVNCEMYDPLGGKTQNVCITLPDVFFLLEDKHVMVEKLLQLLVTEVDANLFERVELENLKA